MKSEDSFHIMNSVDSTNNYAMGQVYAGLATHGMAWFAKEQTAGKGQRGNTWFSKPGRNIMLSISLEPPPFFPGHPFLFNALIANTCRRFLEEYIPGLVKVKWPNDLYIRDRKAGGILIENNYKGKSWKWAIVGIGINVNEEHFPGEIRNPVSIRQVTGKEYDVFTLGRNIHRQIVEAVAAVKQDHFSEILEEYNQHLFRLGQPVKLRKKNIVFETTIDGVNARGLLVTSDTISREFEFGEVEWVL